MECWEGGSSRYQRVHRLDVLAVELDLAERGDGGRRQPAPSAEEIARGPAEAAHRRAAREHHRRAGLAADVDGAHASRAEAAAVGAAKRRRAALPLLALAPTPTAAGVAVDPVVIRVQVAARAARPTEPAAPRCALSRVGCDERAPLLVGQVGVHQLLEELGGAPLLGLELGRHLPAEIGHLPLHLRVRLRVETPPRAGASALAFFAALASLASLASLAAAAAANTAGLQLLHSPPQPAQLGLLLWCQLTRRSPPLELRQPRRDRVVLLLLLAPAAAAAGAAHRPNRLGFEPAQLGLLLWRQLARRLPPLELRQPRRLLRPQPPGTAASSTSPTARRLSRLGFKAA